MNPDKIIVDEFTDLYEISKDDHASKMIVGSEVRNLIGIIRNERARSAVLQAEVRAWRGPQGETLRRAMRDTDSANALENKQ